MKRFLLVALLLPVLLDCIHKHIPQWCMLGVCHETYHYDFHGVSCTDTDHKLFLVDDAGHNPFMEQPERFHDALAEALRPWLVGERPHPVHTVASESLLPAQPDAPQSGVDVAADL